MTRDLEETLAELGPEYRSVVDRLVDAYEPMPRVEMESSPRTGRVIGWSIGYLVAASLLAVAALSVVFLRDASVPANEYFLAREKSQAAVREIIRTQHADGGWSNDFLTRQNAAALERSTVAGAQIAYRKAMRNLRVRGVL